MVIATQHIADFASVMAIKVSRLSDHYILCVFIYLLIYLLFIHSFQFKALSPRRLISLTRR